MDTVPYSKFRVKFRVHNSSGKDGTVELNKGVASKQMWKGCIWSRRDLMVQLSIHTRSVHPKNTMREDMHLVQGWMLIFEGHALGCLGIYRGIPRKPLVWNFFTFCGHNNGDIDMSTITPFMIEISKRPPMSDSLIYLRPLICGPRSFKTITFYVYATICYQRDIIYRRYGVAKIFGI